MHSQKELINKLYQSINERWTTEEVAVFITNILKNLSEKALSKQFYRLKKKHYSYSLMPNTFHSVSSMDRQLRVAKGLFPTIKALDEPFNMNQIRSYIDRLNHYFSIDDSSYQARLHREERKIQKLPRGHRAYNKRFRFLVRLEKKYRLRERLLMQTELAQISKTKLATRIQFDAFKHDPLTACFIAYLVAKLGRRSLFTAQSQQRAYDKYADRLFQKLLETQYKKNADWFSIAHVYPNPKVLAFLSDEERGLLLGKWFAVMKDSAKVLERVIHENPNMDLKNLIVRSGDDSSTFNEAAGAFNVARSGWINTIYSLNLTQMLDFFAPPKALRLMAADVVYIHRKWGSGGLEPDTKVWQMLPKPWEVMSGKANCSRADIENACEKAGISGKGWIKPRPTTIANYSNTPELVHGITVSSPELARRLRTAGFFAGPSKKKTF